MPSSLACWIRCGRRVFSLSVLLQAQSYSPPFFPSLIALQHPRVRYGACNAIGQMSTDFGPRENRQTAVCFQSLFHTQVVPGLCQVTQDVENPRVQVRLSTILYRPLPVNRRFSFGMPRRSAFAV
jgi:hypothetical protein